LNDQPIISPSLRFNTFNKNWKKINLGSRGVFKSGGTPSTSKPEYWTGEIPWISSSDIQENNIHTIKVSKRINKEAIDNSATKLIPINSILFVSRVGVGKVAINTFELCTSQDFNSFIPGMDNSFFLGYLFQARSQVLINLSQGTSIKGFTSKELKKAKFSIPSLPEQQKIADFLTTVDKKIQALEKKKALLEQYKKGVMQKIFNREIRFKQEDGSDYPDWELVTSNIKIVSGIAYALNEYCEKGFILIQGLNIFEDKLEIKTPLYISSSNIRKHVNLFNGDILLALNRPITNGQLKICRYNLDTIGYLYQRAAKLEFDENIINSDFLYQFLRTKIFLKTLSLELFGSDQPYIKSNLFDKVKLIFPCLEEQIQISNLLKSKDLKIKLMNRKINNMALWKKGLLQQMFV